MIRPPARARRQGLEPLLGTAAARWFAARVQASGLAVGAGQGLLVVIGTLVAASAPFLGFSARGWMVLATVYPVVIVLAALSLWCPWNRWSASASLVFPVAGLGALTLLGLGSDGVAFAYVGMIPLWFVYVGVFHRAPAGALLVPLGWGTYLAMVGGISANIVVRLLIYGVAWFATSSILSVLVGRQRAVNEGLLAQTFTDPLTALGNRRGLEAQLATLAPGDSVVICDLDLFKSINDAFGHAAGDEVLRQFGATVSEHLRRRDYAARYGGEEFVLVLVRTDPAQALAALSSLRAEWLELGAGVTFSAGIAAATVGLPPQAVLAAADAALYEAKADGRDCFRLAPAGLVR